MSDNGTILIKNTTKRRLKYIGHKDQTYDELINELLDQKNGHRHLSVKGANSEA
jgi:hypothetical protein